MHDYRSIDLTNKSFDELMLRLSSIEQSLLIFHGLSDRSLKISTTELSDRLDYECLDVYSDTIKSLLLSNIILQFCAILDQKGYFSLRLNNGVVSLKTLQKLLPAVPPESLVLTQNKLNILFRKHDKEIKAMFKIRNLYIAHSGEVRVGVHTELPDWRFYSNFNQIILPVELDLKCLMRFCLKIKAIIQIC